MAQKNEILTVKRIERDGDRTLLFGRSDDYMIITKPNEAVAIGDAVEYEPYGMNFGWFVKKVVKNWTDIDEMQIGQEGWFVSWTMVVDTEGKGWLQPFSRLGVRGGTAQLHVKRSESGYEVTDYSVRPYARKPELPKKGYVKVESFQLATVQAHVSAVLGILTGYLLAPAKTDGWWDLACFMTGKPDTPIHLLPRLTPLCLPSLQRQFPLFAGEDFDRKVSELEARFKVAPDAEAYAIGEEWVQEQYGQYGETVTVHMAREE